MGEFALEIQAIARVAGLLNVLHLRLPRLRRYVIQELNAAARHSGLLKSFDEDGRIRTRTGAINPEGLIQAEIEMQRALLHLELAFGLKEALGPLRAAIGFVGEDLIVEESEIGTSEDNKNG